MNKEKVRANEVAKIDGENISREYLFEQAKKLDALSNHLDLVVKLLSNVNYQMIQGHEFALQHLVGDGQLSCLTDNLQNIQEKVQNISNDICPD